MKKILSFVLLSFLMIGSGTAVAQNNKAPKSKSNDKTTVDKRLVVKKNNNVKSDERRKYFYGTIRYDVVNSKNDGRRKVDPHMTNKPNGAVSIKSQAMQVEESKTNIAAPEDMKVLFFFTKEGTYAHLERYGWASTESAGPLFFVFSDPEKPIVAKSSDKEEMKFREDPKAYYVRTRDTKEIAGRKAVRYECRLPQMKGDIWVDDQYSLFVENVPFYGMMHPVLEFDLKIILEDKEFASYHLVASEIMPEKIEDHMIEQIMNGEFMEMPEVVDKFREMLGL